MSKNPQGRGEVGAGEQLDSYRVMSRNMGALWGPQAGTPNPDCGTLTPHPQERLGLSLGMIPSSPVKKETNPSQGKNTVQGSEAQIEGAGELEVVRHSWVEGWGWGI